MRKRGKSATTRKCNVARDDGALTYETSPTNFLFIFAAFNAHRGMREVALPRPSAPLSPLERMMEERELDRLRKTKKSRKSFSMRPDKKRSRA